MLRIVELLNDDSRVVADGDGTDFDADARAIGAIVDCFSVTLAPGMQLATRQGCL